MKVEVKHLTKMRARLERARSGVTKAQLAMDIAKDRVFKQQQEANQAEKDLEAVTRAWSIGTEIPEDQAVKFGLISPVAKAQTQNVA